MGEVDLPGRSYTDRTPLRCVVHGRSRRSGCSGLIQSSPSTWRGGCSGPTSFSAYVISVTINYNWPDYAESHDQTFKEVDVFVEHESLYQSLHVKVDASPDSSNLMQI